MYLLPLLLLGLITMTRMTVCSRFRPGVEAQRFVRSARLARRLPLLKKILSAQQTNVPLHLVRNIRLLKLGLLLLLLLLLL